MGTSLHFNIDAKQTWRSSQYLLAGCGVLSLILVYFFLPETSHPPLPHDTVREERGKKFVLYLFNPFTSLGLFRWWNIVFIVRVALGLHYTLTCRLSRPVASCLRLTALW